MAYQFLPFIETQGQPAHPKIASHAVGALEEEGARRDQDEASDDSNGINGVTEEFMVHLARAVKDTQTEEKCCYHCSSPEHFIHNCLPMKTLREKLQLSSKEGMTSKKGAQTPLTTATMLKNLQMEVPKV